MNRYFFRIYIGYRNRILLGYKLDFCKEYFQEYGSFNLEIYLPFVEFFIQRVGKGFKTPFWGGIVIGN
jgi:hypothetical protein